MHPTTSIPVLAVRQLVRSQNAAVRLTATATRAVSTTTTTAASSRRPVCSSSPSCPCCSRSARLPSQANLRPCLRTARQQAEFQTRTYHSRDHPAPAGPFSQAEQAILSAAYKHVPEHGFSQEALALGARDAGYLDISTTILPEGVFSLIRWHLVTQRDALARRRDALFGSESEQQEGGGAKVPVEDKVEALTWERLLANRDVISRWQEALAVMAHPTHVPGSLHELALLADEILFLAGDRSVDPSWYTKRASLSTIYVSAELFMTNDRSPDFSETRRFLRRRLQESRQVGGAFGAVREWAGFTATAAVNMLRSKGVRI